MHAEGSRQRARQHAAGGSCSENALSLLLGKLQPAASLHLVLLPVPPVPLQNEELELQYKTCYARILDSKRRFLEAATRYYELSQVGKRRIGDSEVRQVAQEGWGGRRRGGDRRRRGWGGCSSAALAPFAHKHGLLGPARSLMCLHLPSPPACTHPRLQISEEDLEQALQSAVRCAILAAAGPQRSRMLATLYKDERCARLALFPFLEKVYLERILQAAEVRA